MHVQFEYTIEEQVTALLDHTLQSARARFRMQRDRFTTALSAAAILYLLMPPGLGLRPYIALAVAAVWAMFFPRIWRVLVKRRLNRFVRASLPAEGPYICNVDLGEDGVRVGQQGMETTYPWSDIADVAEHEDAVELVGTDGGGVVVNGRAFATQAERGEFVELARRRIAEAGVAEAE